MPDVKTEYPRWLYKTYEDAVLVTSAEDEQQKRSEGYKDTYTLPKVKK